MFVFKIDNSGSIVFVEHNNDNASYLNSSDIIKSRQSETIQTDNQNILSNASQTIDSNSSNELTPNDNTSDIAHLNELFINKLDEGKGELIFLMRHSAIEDGSENEVVEYIKPFYDENKFMTILWLYKIYSEYQGDSVIFAGLLNLLFFLKVKQSDIPYLTSIISNGLNSPFSMVQELAIKLTEKFRTKDCLVALKLSQFKSAWIASYAHQIIIELEKELY